MEPRLILFFTTFLLLFVPSFSLHHDLFLQCITNHFHEANSNTDIIYNSSSYHSHNLLLAPNLRPQSTCPDKPNLIVTPIHESEIRAMISCSKKLGFQIRVRSGGHDYEGLSYTSSEADRPFIIVDMRNLRSISINEDEKTAWVGAGAILGELYYALSLKSKKIAAVAGLCPTVGIGGHISGGGYSMLSRMYGVAADHVIDARVMNGDGDVVDRKSMGDDLFWAIRGGGGTSFGIVIEFKLALVTVPATVTVFNATRMSEDAIRTVHRWQYIADKLDEKVSFKVMLSSGTTQSGKPTAIASFWSLYLGPARDLLLLMEREFPELNVVKKDCIEMSWIESTRFFAGLSNEPLEVLLERTPQGYHAPVYFKGKSDFVKKPIPINVLRRMWKFLAQEDGSQLQFSPFGGVFNTIPESATPFPHRSGIIFMIHYRVGWTDLSESDRRMDWIRRLYGFMASYVTKSPRTAYVNYRDLDIGSNDYARGRRNRSTIYREALVWGEKYFKNNFARLVHVKSNVDPSNFFRNEQSIPPF